MSKFKSIFKSKKNSDSIYSTAEISSAQNERGDLQKITDKIFNKKESRPMLTKSTKETNVSGMSLSFELPSFIKNSKRDDSTDLK